MGSLILADSSSESLVFTDIDSNPYSLRLCACRNIVNAVSLAMRTDFSQHDEGPGLPSILLLDPYPDYMTAALVRTGSSLFPLHAKQQISSQSVMSMFSTVIAALEILGEISHLAVEAIPLLRAKYAESEIGQIASSNNRQQNDVFYQAALSVASPIDENLFNAGIVAELEQQANNPGLVDTSVIQTETNLLLSSFLTDEIEHVNLDLFSQEWTLDVSNMRPEQPVSLNIREKNTSTNSEPLTRNVSPSLFSSDRILGD
jgi:hypothetical protein